MDAKLSWEEIQANAVAFSARWKGAWDEKSEAQSFVRDFLAVFGVKDAAAVGRFEERAVRDKRGTEKTADSEAPLDADSLRAKRSTGVRGKGGQSPSVPAQPSADLLRARRSIGFMDYLWPKRIAVEMKTKGKDLDAAYEQLKEYVLHLPADAMPDLLLVSDFENIIVHRRTTGAKKHFKTADLHKNVRQFACIAGFEATHDVEEEIEVNVLAAEKMARLHDALKARGFDGHNLEVYLVRLLFCLFADDTGIFPQQVLTDYVQNSKEDGSDLSDRIARLFEILNMPDEMRAKRTLLSPALTQFRYINGGLFQELLPSAEFDAKMRGILIDCCHFDWNNISPAIFGAMFQGVMDKGQRREFGAHYTSEENILKLINPLFMDSLWSEFRTIMTKPKELADFHDKIAGLKFLDPACGCGNFLIIAYRELRLLELEILKAQLEMQKMQKGGRHKMLDVDAFLKVGVGQFHGIEIEEFPCQIAQVGMWLMDHLMNMKVSKECGQYYIRLPLTQSAGIVQGNALQIDWESVVPKHELSYILGNPPFIGNNNLSAAQRQDIAPFFPANKTMDYVAAWYVKAASFIEGTEIRCAFVSTNSITQGEQAAILWKPLLGRGMHIQFGVRTFKWSNEAKGKAAVHCVIVGFDNERPSVPISPYLIEGSETVIESRAKPLCAAPHMQRGNQPTDGGNLIIEADEYDEFIAMEPQAVRFIRRLVGSEEFINNRPRWCLWLVNATPADLRSMPKVMDRVEKVRQMRLASPDKGTRRLADTPTLFRETNNPETYVVIPRVSSERRHYIPMGFLGADTITTDSVHIIPDATLYHFGVLTSSVHMAWARVVCGRLKSDYRYSKDIVYNNFPWPEATEKQKAEIEALAQVVLDARANHPESTLADLYDPLTMPPDLHKAHNALDRAVMKLYGFPKDASEPAVVTELMELYRGLVGK